ncbi:MAG TPA: thioredoxin domain-containing protein [Symbiobacteriaceae bacterium]|jgi:protein-disulfide isomerase
MGKNSPGRKQPKKATSPIGWIVAAVVVVVGLLIGVSYFSNQSKTPSGTAGSVPAPTGSVPAPAGPVKTDAELGAKGSVKGPDSAKVKLVEYGDFQCPSCGVAHMKQEPLLEPLITSGQVQFTFKHFIVVDANVGGSESQWAAEAAECAGDQGKFWAMHDYLYEHQNGEGKGNFVLSRLKQFGATLGLEPVAFNKCLDSHTYSSRVKQQSKEAENLRLEGTPSFLVNGKLVKDGDFVKAVKEAVK